MFGFRAECSAVFIGRSFTLVFNLSLSASMGLLWRRRIVNLVTPISNSCSIISVRFCIAYCAIERDSLTHRFEIA